MLKLVVCALFVTAACAKTNDTLPTTTLPPEDGERSGYVDPNKPDDRFVPLGPTQGVSGPYPWVTMVRRSKWRNFNRLLFTMLNLCEYYHRNMYCDDIIEL